MCEMTLIFVDRGENVQYGVGLYEAWTHESPGESWREEAPLFLAALPCALITRM